MAPGVRSLSVSKAGRACPTEQGFRTSSERALEQDGACTCAPRVTWAPAARLRSMKNTRIVLRAPGAERNAPCLPSARLLDPSAPSAARYK